jgi:TPR repeat protein
MAPAEPAPVEANPPTSTQEIATPDEHRERVIASLGQLLSSGRPLSDLLDEAKRLAASFSEPTGSNGSEPKDAIALLGKSAHHAAAPERNADITHALESELASLARRHQVGALRLGRLTGRIAFWLLPAIALTVLTAAFATLPVAETVFAKLPVTDAVSLAPTLTVELPAKPPEVSPDGSSAGQIVDTNKGSPEPSPPIQSLSAEHVAEFLARGDALLTGADVNSGRLFYEHAAAAGSAQAALRLGASYDPLFLSFAGLKGMRGDPDRAAYWYKRARDLGAVAEAEALLKSLDVQN